jgi:hypothetical protein
MYVYVISDASMTSIICGTNKIMRKLIRVAAHLHDLLSVMIKQQLHGLACCTRAPLWPR